MAEVLLSGRFCLACNGERTPWFDNLITDAGLDRIGTDEYLTRVSIGTGTTEPAVSDLGLEALLASTDNLTTSVTEVGWHQRTFLFSSGSSEAVTITEVGIGWDTGLFSRAVLPEPLEVPSGRDLTVVYELTLVPPEYDDVYEIDIGGVTTACTARAALVGDGSEGAWGLAGDPISFDLGPDNAPLIYDGALGDTTSSPSGTAVAHSSQTAYSYTPGSLYLELEGRWNIDIGNLTDGAASTLFRTNGYGAYQIGFDPPLTKTCYDTLRLTYRVSWGRLASSS